MVEMTECAMTFNGRHHYAFRRWLTRLPSGEPSNPDDEQNWSDVYACVCAKLGTEPEPVAANQARMEL
tara:strand:+ start:1752 stop:1955 length:204 start_codon:yes stop_codon:yes gene_type:complete